jgi:hypothetical protein
MKSSRDLMMMMMMMMMTEMALETSVSYGPLTRLIAREDFIKYKFIFRRQDT